MLTNPENHVKLAIVRIKNVTDTISTNALTIYKIY
jgi:hypothetical protein